MLCSCIYGYIIKVGRVTNRSGIGTVTQKSKDKNNLILTGSSFTTLCIHVIQFTFQKVKGTMYI